MTLYALGRLVEIDARTRKLGRTVDLAMTARSLAVSGDGSRLFVTRFISPQTHGELFEVNAASFQVTRTIKLAADTHADTEDRGAGVPNYLAHVIISPVSHAS